MNILFTCAGRRNYLINYFKEALEGQGLVIAADMLRTAPAMVAANKAFVVPSVYDDSYVERILEICVNEKVDVVVSLNDLELPILSGSFSRFKLVSTMLLISNENVIDTCFDKIKTIELASSIGILTPKTFTSFKEAKDAIDEGILTFPLVVKPRWGSASMGLEFPDSIKELELAFELLSLRIHKTMLGKASAQDIDRAILIQEKIQGIEYGLDILNDFNGKTEQVYVKEKLAMRSGETDKAILRNHNELENIGFVIGNKLGHIGNLDCDIFESDGKYYLIELNPRFGGGYPFTHMSGGNYVAAIVAWLKGERYDFSNFKKDYDYIYAKSESIIGIGNV